MEDWRSAWPTTTIPVPMPQPGARNWEDLVAILDKHAQPPMGCVCPAGANATCENPLCPRKNLLRGLFE